VAEHFARLTDRGTPVTLMTSPGDTYTLHHGDCLTELRAMPNSSVDSIVTDPPYGLSSVSPENVTSAIVKWAGGDREYSPEGRGFMGNAWDAFVPPPAVWDECIRVLKPGGHLLSFAGSRTIDIMTISIRMAGFDIRDTIMWIYGTGFPNRSTCPRPSTRRRGRARGYRHAARRCRDTGRQLC